MAAAQGQQSRESPDLVLGHGEHCLICTDLNGEAIGTSLPHLGRSESVPARMLIEALAGAETREEVEAGLVRG